MIVDVIGGAGQSVNGLSRISASNVRVVSIEFSKRFLKNGNPEGTVWANGSEIGLISSQTAAQRKVIINDYSVRHTE